MALGALVVALFVSVALSSCAAVLLEASSGFSSDIFAVAFVRAVLAAIAQPTITGIALLAVLVVGAASAARVGGLVEDIQILLDAHKAVVEDNNSPAPATLDPHPRKPHS
ncbi:hypothetical protein DQ04_09321030 [Trypanosoma grayi]|uniref:hypothetical protein n=1 Tax=Trypanosoma grayi TaxID=71804 RepID=UPI0004F4214F|nr:hypothetical protein DQ04_09321030 [Trypanosoma grayi]KEG07597.1 hypothetical protein DQ04_09321030 [Trypanosoma grayi]